MEVADVTYFTVFWAKILLKGFEISAIQDDEGGDIDEGEEGTKEKPSTTGSLGKTRAQNLSGVKN